MIVSRANERGSVFVGRRGAAGCADFGGTVEVNTQARLWSADAVA